jgi:hypothetical protein
LVLCEWPTNRRPLSRRRREILDWTFLVPKISNFGHGFVHLIGEIKSFGSILTGCNCYRSLGCQILAVQRIFLLSFSKQVKCLKTDWGRNNPNILDTFWELNHYLLAVPRPSRRFSASFDRHLDSSKPALGISSSIVSVYRSYHLLCALFKESYEKDKAAYSL